MKLKSVGVIDTPHGALQVRGDLTALLWLADRLRPADPRIVNPLWFRVSDMTPEQVGAAMKLAPTLRIRLVVEA
ncbi:MAG TPA: hypothetical protein VM915_09755 [Verrucomicrobiae bacterium]|jgi:hypothetical protein|nr:hypothetical protein [Verrucomicrobiae bacterium]